MKDLQNKKITQSIFLAGFSLLMFSLSSVMQQKLIIARGQDHIRLHSGIRLENTTPLMAVSTVALGGFRGLIADLLWLRASATQDEGLYFETAQLADWITKLEPSFTQVWAYHAWNMTYNISAIFSAEDSRERWVWNGIRLLRDEGLKYNPNDANLYRELGWMYQHKLGGIYDTSHNVYKRHYVRDVSQLFDQIANLEELSVLPQNDVLGTMDTELMLRIQEQYNGLDWRLPESASIYFATRGLLASGEQGNLSCQRMIYQNLRKLFFKGTLTVGDNEDLYFTPDLSKFKPTIDAYISAIDQYDNETVPSAYRNFLAGALPIMTLHDKDAEARMAWNSAFKLLGPDKLDTSFERFLVNNTPESYSDIPPDELTAVMFTYYYKAAKDQLLGLPDRSVHFENFGNRLWVDLTNNMDEADRQHYNIPPLTVMRGLAETAARADLAKN
jgi:hypothetical protein